MGDNGRRTVNRRIKKFKNQEKLNLEETKVVNQGHNNKVKKTRVSIFLA